MGELIGGTYTSRAYVGVPGRIDAYEATDANGTKVALMTAKATTQVDVDRFASRAQGAAALSHPDIARIIDWGSDGDTFFAAEEWINGTNLKAGLDDRGAPYSATMVARFGVQVAAALAAAHARGIVHGDLRPEDIILVAPEDVRVVGFGAPTTADPVVLAPDTSAKTAHYISPEQARGGGATASSDIYSLGAVLYHLATGSVPFDGTSGPQVASLHASQPLESPRAVNPEVPASLESVIVKAMHKDPAQRYGSAEELRAALQRIASGGPAAATAVMPVVEPSPTLAPVVRKRSPWPWILGILAVALLAFGLWYFLRGDTEVPDLAGMTLEEAQAALVTAGLELGDAEYSDAFPEGTVDGTVFDQNPEAGDLVSEGAAVDITLAGTQLADVPDVIGLPESEAALVIREAGFDLGTIEREFSADIEAGTVISQTPAGGGQAPLGSPITIGVSKGTEVVSVPGVVGQSAEQATQTLEDAGLSVRVTEEYSDSVAEGAVISQNPSAGVSVDAGTQVAVVVSLGAEPVAQIRVPTLEGLLEEDAIDEIEAVGLVADVETTTDPENVGRVVSQDPERDTMVDLGSTVTITVGE